MATCLKLGINKKEKKKVQQKLNKTKAHFYPSQEGSVLKLKKTPSTAKPHAAKSEEKFKEPDIVPSCASKKVYTYATQLGKTASLRTSLKKSRFHPMKCLCKHHLPVLFSPLLHWWV